MNTTRIMLKICLATSMLAAIPLLTGCGAAVGTLEPHRFTTLPPDHTEATVYYPKGDVTESVLMMRTSGPKTIRAGEQFTYKIELYNPTDRTIIKNITVSDYLPQNFELVSSTPSWSDLNRLEPKEALVSELREPNTDLDDVRKTRPVMRKGRYVECPAPHDADRVQWFIGELYPEKLVTIRVRGKAVDEGNWMSCAMASYDLSACMAAKVVAPELKLAVNLDREFILCETDQTDLTMRVSNTGSGTTKDITVTAKLPEGLSHHGNRTITEKVGTLAAGKTKTITKSLRVHNPGTYVVRASARARGGVRTEAATVTLTAREPVLDIETTGPVEEYVGLPIEYEISVSNTGDAPARDLVIENPVPNGTEFVDATNNGQLDGDTVRWHLDELPPGQYVPLSVRFEGENKGHVRSVATARSACSADVTAIARTHLEGIASMVVKVVDTQDPIRVGNDEVYEIRVHNQGSAPETDVLVECVLPDGQELISASGTTTTRSGPGASKIVFRPVTELAADETATWRVKVRGTRAGDMRFRVAVDSDQHGRPVRETEATRVFD